MVGYYLIIFYFMAKTYVNGLSCKAKSWQFWEFFNISINVDTLKQYANEKGYVNVVMSKRREVWQYWDTHYFTLNEWTPENTSNSPQNSASTENESQGEISIEDIPF
jgi:hypothetical protein